MACPLEIIHPYAEVMYADKIFAPFITGVVLVTKLQECEVDHTVGQPGCDDRFGNALEPKSLLVELCSFLLVGNGNGDMPELTFGHLLILLAVAACKRDAGVLWEGTRFPHATGPEAG